MQSAHLTTWLVALIVVLVGTGCVGSQLPAGPETKRWSGSSSEARVATEGFPRAIGKRLVLATAPATWDGSLAYELSIGACEGRTCPVLISLLQRDKMLDERRAEWNSTTREPTKEGVGLGWGAGDPAGPPEGVVAWSTGEEEGYLGTAARVVRLSSELNGLLLDQRAGFEHVKRHHELIVHNGSKLVRAWSAGEGAGPAWTSTAIVSAEGGRDVVLFFNGFRYPLTDRPDTLNVSELEWDVASRKIVAKQPERPVEAAVIGGFSSVADARKAKAARRDCLGAFWVLPASAARQADKSGFILAVPAVASARARALSQCAEDRRPRIVPFAGN